MAARRETPGEYCFAAEAMAGTAAAAALRRVRSLADQAPSGRMFSAIATLSDMSRRIGANLEAGHDALANGKPDTATLEFARAITHMDHLAATADHAPEIETLPGYLRKNR